MKSILLIMIGMALAAAILETPIRTLAAKTAAKVKTLAKKTAALIPLLSPGTGTAVKALTAVKEMVKKLAETVRRSL